MQNGTDQASHLESKADEETFEMQHKWLYKL